MTVGVGKGRAAGEGGGVARVDGDVVGCGAEIGEGTAEGLGAPGCALEQAATSTRMAGAIRAMRGMTVVSNDGRDGFGAATATVSALTERRRRTVVGIPAWTIVDPVQAPSMAMALASPNAAQITSCPQCSRSASRANERRLPRKLPRYEPMA